MSTRNWLAQRFMKRTGTADIRPVSRRADGGEPVLDEVVLYREGGNSDGRLRLHPDQAVVLQARLRQIRMAFQPENQTTEVPTFMAGIVAPEHDPVYQGDERAVKVWPITQQVGDELPVLVEVLVRHDGKDFLIHAEEVIYIDSRLTHVLVAFLHQNQWGGEDARAQ